MDKEQKSSGMGTGTKVAIGCFVLIVLSVICVVAFMAMGVLGASKVVEEVGKEIEAQEQIQADKFDSPKALNEAVTVSEVEWVVTEAKDLGDTLKSSYGEYGDDCVAESGRYIQVKFTVKNVGTEMASVSNLDLFDSKKREFVTASDIYSCVDDSIFILENINPGLSKSYTLIYEVPEDATGLRVKVGDLDLFNDNFEYVSLGL